jgi:hypothetical protein
MARKTQLHGVAVPLRTGRIPFPWQKVHEGLASPITFDRSQIIVALSLRVHTFSTGLHPFLSTANPQYPLLEKRQQFKL